MPKLFPGFGGAPQVPPPPPPPPTREDPAVLAARERLRLSERRRVGRSATNLTGGGAGLGNSAVSRPDGRPSQLLGE